MGCCCASQVVPDAKVHTETKLTEIPIPLEIDKSSEIPGIKFVRIITSPDTQNQKFDEKLTSPLEQVKIKPNEIELVPIVKITYDQGINRDALLSLFLDSIPKNPPFTNQISEVDDRRRFLLDKFPSEFNIESLKLCILAYVGCLLCINTEACEYRKEKLSVFPIKSEYLPYKDCRGPNCRYCGLSFYHHLGNREFSKYSDYFDEFDGDYNPRLLYCTLRCPIHKCAQCGNPFTKIAETHLCAFCLAEFRSLPKIQQLWRPIGQNRYVDEIDSNVILPRKMVGRHETYSHGKHGTTMHTVYYNRIDRDLADKAVKEFLDRTEYTCGVCRNRFRLALVIPKIITIRANLNDLKSEPIVKWGENHSREVVVCGFCPIG